MRQPFSLGPVFAYEWLTRSRGWQSYAARGVFVLALLGGLWLVWQSAAANTMLTPRQQLVQAGEGFFHTLTIVEIALVLLAAPAATAGAICLDKARGSLAHVLVTDLTDREVVLGKLAARLVPVLNLLACALPVAALGTLLGGIDPLALTGSFLIAAGVACLGCSLALALSIWMAKAHEVMIVVFALWSAWLLALPVYLVYWNGPFAPRWLQVSNPFWLATAPSHSPLSTSLVEPVGFLLACLAPAIGLAVLAVAGLRPAYLHQAGRVPKAARASGPAAWRRRRPGWWPGPSLDGNPVLWREWHRNRPSRAVRLVWGAYIAITSLVSLQIMASWSNGVPPGGVGRELGSIVNGLQVSVGLLLLAASAGTVLSEERVRGSLDVLLATPLPTRSIVWGKWWGATRRAPWLAFWPAWIAFSVLPRDAPAGVVAFACLIPTIVLVQGAALAGLGLALATWFQAPGRAVGWTVATLVLSVVGWPMVGSLLFRAAGDPANVLAMGSPFWNAGYTTHLLERAASGGKLAALEAEALTGLIAWTLAYATIAVGLYLATLLSFDRCLGRTSERSGGRRPHPTPPGRHVKPTGPSEAWVGELDEWEVDGRLVP